MDLGVIPALWPFPCALVGIASLHAATAGNSTIAFLPAHGALGAGLTCFRHGCFNCPVPCIVFVLQNTSKGPRTKACTDGRREVVRRWRRSSDRPRKLDLRRIAVLAPSAVLALEIIMSRGRRIYLQSPCWYVGSPTSCYSCSFMLSACCVLMQCRVSPMGKRRCTYSRGHLKFPGSAGFLATSPNDSRASAACNIYWNT